VPQALGGQLILPEASCRSCEQITGNTEQLALRGAFRHLRHVRRYRRSATHPAPDKLPIWVPGVSGKDDKVEIETEKYPGVHFFPPMGAAGIVLGVPPGFTYGPEHRWNRLLVTSTGPIVAAGGVKQFSTPSLDVFSFCRMLAKIAHGYAYAELGEGGFKARLREIILGEADNIFHYVGAISNDSDEPNAPLETPYTVALNSYAIRGRIYAVVEIRVFADVRGSPVYHVIPGELIAQLPKLHHGAE
jgi:hypothetical protein